MPLASDDRQIPIFLLGARQWIRELRPDRREVEARRAVKMLILPRLPDRPMTDSEVPDALVTAAMVERYLELDPPFATVNQEFQAIITEIDYTYVQGNFFSTVSASCVTIERILNLARIELHHHCPKIKDLWGKGPLNEWYGNIEALQGWGYLDPDFAKDLETIYRDIRCRYLHSGAIKDFQADALTSARAAYRLLGLLVGFPPDLFGFEAARMKCKDTSDPRYLVFYLPYMTLPERDGPEPLPNG